MSDLKNMLPFRVPHNYFNYFDKKLIAKIDLDNNKSDFKVPENYFLKFETKIISKINFNKAKTAHLFRRFIASAAVILAIIFTTFDSSVEGNIETNILIMENYLMENSTYEIADHIPNYLSFDMISMDQSIDYEDALELSLLSESPINLNLFDDE